MFEKLLLKDHATIGLDLDDIALRTEVGAPCTWPMDPVAFSRTLNLRTMAGLLRGRHPLSLQRGRHAASAAADGQARTDAPTTDVHVSWTHTTRRAWAAKHLRQ